MQRFSWQFPSTRVQWFECVPTWKSAKHNFRSHVALTLWEKKGRAARLRKLCCDGSQTATIVPDSLPPWEILPSYLCDRIRLWNCTNCVTSWPWPKPRTSRGRQRSASSRNRPSASKSPNSRPNWAKCSLNGWDAECRTTDAGRALYRRAVTILGAVDEAKTSVHADADWRSGLITVAAIPTIAPYLLPELIRSFDRKFPAARFTLQVHDEVVKDCLAGDADVGILALPIDDERLTVEPLFTEELLLVTPARHKLAKRRSPVTLTTWPKNASCCLATFTV